MENQRPPRSNSSGQKSYFGRARAAPSFRGDKSKGDPVRGPRRSERSGDGRYNDGIARDGNSPRRDPRFDGNHSNRFGGGRLDRKTGDGRNLSKFGKNQKVEIEIKITSEDQITDGKFRGKKLLNSDSPNSLRTERKVREIVFKVISRRVKAGRVLDLGAGSGTIGIEAISRGAMLATFVERSARMCTFIRKNLAEMGVKDGHGEVVEIEIIPFLKKAMLRKRGWDVVYFDVPEGEEHSAILDNLSRGSAIKSRGLLIIQHAAAVSHPDNINQLKRWRTIDQGETILTIYERM